MRQRSQRKIGQRIRPERKPRVVHQRVVHQRRIVHRRLIHRRIVHPQVTLPPHRAKNQRLGVGQSLKLSPRVKRRGSRLVRPRAIRRKLMRPNRPPSLRLRMLQLQRARPVQKVSQKLRARRILRLGQRHQKHRGKPHRKKALLSRSTQPLQKRALPSRPTRPRPSPLLAKARQDQPSPEPRPSPLRLPSRRGLPLRRSRLNRRSTNLSSRLVEDHLASIHSLAIFVAR